MRSVSTRNTRSWVERGLRGGPCSMLTVLPRHHTHTHTHMSTQMQVQTHGLTYTNTQIHLPTLTYRASHVVQMVKNLPFNAGETGLIPGSGRSPGDGNGNPLQYSCLGSPMVRGAWWATVQQVSKSQTRLNTKQQHSRVHTNTLIPMNTQLQTFTYTHAYTHGYTPRHKPSGPSITDSVPGPRTLAEAMGKTREKIT